MTPYDKLIDRKRKWTPVAVEGGPVAEGTEDAISRCLALRVLEIPVGDFIAEASNKEVPESARKILSMNITDEINHDIALNYVADTYSVDAQTTKEASSLAKAWIDHPDHPIVKANGFGEIDILHYPPLFPSFWKCRNENHVCRYQS